MNDLPVGAPTPVRPWRRPEHVVLNGRWIDLAPLSAARHAPDLFDAIGRSQDDALWTYMGDGPFADEASFTANIAAKEASGDPLFFALIEKKSGRAVGHAALMRIDAANGVVEVGNIIYARSLQRTAAATEAMALLASYVFETLLYRRYEWKCNDFNAPSKRAALRLGFSHEGLFRQHLIVKGRNRDTAWFSMLDGEWPSRKAAFEAFLAAENFDAEGRQKRPLASFRA